MCCFACKYVPFCNLNMCSAIVSKPFCTLNMCLVSFYRSTVCLQKCAFLSLAVLHLKYVLCRHVTDMLHSNMSFAFVCRFAFKYVLCSPVTDLQLDCKIFALQSLINMCLHIYKIYFALLSFCTYSYTCKKIHVVKNQTYTYYCVLFKLPCNITHMGKSEEILEKKLRNCIPVHTHTYTHQTHIHKGIRARAVALWHTHIHTSVTECGLANLDLIARVFVYVCVRKPRVSESGCMFACICTRARRCAYTRERENEGVGGGSIHIQIM